MPLYSKSRNWKPEGIINEKKTPESGENEQRKEIKKTGAQIMLDHYVHHVFEPSP